MVRAVNFLYVAFLNGYLTTAMLIKCKMQQNSIWMGPESMVFQG